MKNCAIAILILAGVFGGLVTFTSSAEPDDERSNLVGVWRGGWPNEQRPRYEIVVTANKISGRNLSDGTSLGEGTFVMDVKRKRLDATGTADRNRGITYLGIYSLNGDTLHWCSNNGGRNRPAEFVHRPSADQYLLVLKRQR